MLRKLCYSLMILVLFASCGGDDNVEGQNDLSGKKVFRYNQAEGLSSLDPAFARNQANIWATTQLFSGLFELTDELYTAPNLADTWKISDDGLVYTITIQKGVKFHDNECFPEGEGRELKASDFVYSFNRILDPATASTGAWVFRDKIKVDENGEIAEDWVKAIDDYTLEITLNEPFAPFLEILTMPYTFPVPKEAVDKYGKDFRTNPVGTGPFMLNTWKENNTLIMVKNEDYWKKDINGKQLPYLDAVEVSFINDKNQELLTFQQGKLDFVSGILSASVDLILNKDGEPKEEFEKEHNCQIYKEPYLNTEYIGFMMDKSVYEDANHPFLNKDFRKALNYAINREELVSGLLNNLGRPGNSGIVPAALPSFDAEVVKGYEYNTKKAEELLKKSGYDASEYPSFDLYTTIQSKDIIEYLKNQWNSIGVNVNIQINQVPQHQEMVDNSKVKFFRGSWLGDYPDAENYLSMFYSKYYAPAGPNKTHFSNEDYDSLYNVAKETTDGFKRFDLYQKMDNIIVEEAPVIVLFYDEVVRLVHDNIQNLQSNPMNVLKLEKVDIQDPETLEASTEGSEDSSDDIEVITE
ncbi:ABC transporter substrate-binding protein [Mangrovivirga cuniculi]|uniref:ABC transporter substrate-binding protein n=1 Tax=Mangrovivirga cuniculi TaxID=2715131 RepID=A0A4D7JTN7_9BACT|nr:ABC transporter substrate-binding protein [Mangrovivirga cuniculi]QCK16032.1 ABC transporter substrate-binding protein [Mangrovivirga cuniculi]